MLTQGPTTVLWHKQKRCVKPTEKTPTQALPKEACCACRVTQRPCIPCDSGVPRLYLPGDTRGHPGDRALYPLTAEVTYLFGHQVGRHTWRRTPTPLRAPWRLLANTLSWSFTPHDLWFFILCAQSACNGCGWTRHLSPRKGSFR